MQSMKQEETLVVGGVDAHADTHHAAALDERGVLLATTSFPTTTPGYAELLGWLGAFGAVAVVAVESTGAYAAALVRYLREHDVRVVEVNQPHAHTRRRVGKSDPIDAEMAARLFLAGKAKAIPKQTDGIVESIRLLRAARHSAVKSRSAAMVQLGGLIVTAPQELRDQLSSAKTIRGKAALCRRLRPSIGELRRPTHASRFALRSIAGRIDALDNEIAVLDRQLEQLVRAAAPRTIGLLGISTGHAGQLLVTAGQNIERLRGEAAFAALCGASPIPTSSGKTTRPPQLRRRPPGQPHAAPDRRVSPALLRSHPRLHATPHRRGQDQARDHALPQALHRPRGLPRPTRRPRRATTPSPHRDRHHQLQRRPDRNHTTPHLTSIGTSARTGWRDCWWER
jgi:transposase